jgi:hypothetical protein
MERRNQWQIKKKRKEKREELTSFAIDQVWDADPCVTMLPTPLA